MSAPEPPSAETPPATAKDRLLLVFFWAWASVLAVATLAQLFGWKSVTSALDVKNWFQR
jgi:hypothetical protein